MPPLSQNGYSVNFHYRSPPSAFFMFDMRRAGTVSLLADRQASGLQPRAPAIRSCVSLSLSLSQHNVVDAADRTMYCTSMFFVAALLTINEMINMS